MKKQKYYIVYKTTNLINQHFYVGVHQTTDPNDSYFGSGKLIRQALREFGPRNFRREVIKVCNTLEEAFELEKFIVDRDFLLRKDVYNVKLGGGGVTDYFDRADTQEARHAASVLGGYQSKELKKGVHGLSTEQRIENGKLGAATCKKLGVGFYNPDQRNKALEASRSESAKTKRIETLKRINHQQKDKNSQYGTMWIKSAELQLTCRVPKDFAIPVGWVKGRSMSYKCVPICKLPDM